MTKEQAPYIMPFVPGCHMSDWTGKGRQFFGLTQTCRQLRKEYLPVYLGHTYCWIRYYHLYAYLETFVEPQRSLGQIPVGRVDLDLDPDYEDMDFPVIDLLPLLKLSADAPELHVSISSQAEKVVLSAISNVKKNTCWALNMHSKLKHILLQYSNTTGVELEIIVNREWGEDWMRFGNSSRGYQNGRSDWYRRIGLDTVVNAQYPPDVSIEGQPRSNNRIS
jgi:hypothetical protein